MKTKEFKTKNFIWLDIEKPTKEKLNEITKKYNLYKLDIEDCLVVTEKPKLVEHYGYLFLTVKYPLYLIEEKETSFEELEIFVGKDYLLTFHSGKIPFYLDFLKSLTINDIEKSYPNVGNLLYAILRELHISYFPLLEKLSNEMAEIQRNIFQGREKEMVKKIAIVYRNILDFKKIVRPQVEVMEKLEKRLSFFEPKEKMANLLEDLTEKATEVWTALKSISEVTLGLERTNDALIQHKTNEIVIILTIFSVIILPLTFIVSIYGMNIPWMPAIHSPYAFWIICGIMVVITVAMLAYFKKRKWI